MKNPDLNKITAAHTEAEILAARTPKGGYSKESLAKLGVPWPPPSGWKEKLISNWAIKNGKPAKRKGKPQKAKSENHNYGSGTSDYYKNAARVLSGATFASGRRKSGPEASPSKDKG